MRTIITLVPFLLCTALVAQDAPKAAEPDYANSFFFLQPDSSLKPLERESVAASSKIHALGYGGAEVFYQVQNDHSPVRTTAAKLPAIIVKLESPTTDPANVVAAYTLTVAKGERQLQYARSHFFGGAKNTMQTKEVALNFAKYGQASVKITPANPLPPGEYALIVTGGMQQPIAFCFGVDPAAP